MAQLAERPLLTPEIRGLNPDIGKKIFKRNYLSKRKKTKKKKPGVAQFKKQKQKKQFYVICVFFYFLVQKTQSYKSMVGFKASLISFDMVSSGMQKSFFFLIAALMGEMSLIYLFCPSMCLFKSVSTSGSTAKVDFISI